MAGFRSRFPTGPMSTILLTYEFGAGLGHLNRLIAVAKRLEGHRLVFAVPDLALGGPAVRRAFGEAAEVVAGTVWPAPTSPDARKVPTHTFADVITLFGFADVAQLRGAAERAARLLGEVAPDLVIADFAPTLRLVSQGRVPTVVVGNGYTVPPPGRPLLPMRPWEDAVGPSSRAEEGRLLAAVNQVRAERAGSAIDHFADLFGGERSFVCTIAEFDPYGSGRTSPVIWPFNIPEIRAGGPLAARRGSAVFCYFQAGHPALEAVLKAVSALDIRSEVYVQGLDPQAVAARCSRKVAVHRTPADFAKILPETPLLVHHAGLGTATAGLLAGTGQIVVPLNLEHAITARGVGQFGSGLRLGVSPPPSAEQVRNQIRGMLGDPKRHEAAARAASDLAARRVADPVAPIAEACLAAL